MNSKYQVSLEVLSEKHTADKIIRVIGLKPDRIIKKGDKKSKTSLIHKSNIWILDSDIDNTTSTSPINEYIRPLLDRVSKYSAGFEKINNNKEYFIQCSCVIECDCDPPLGLTPDVLLGLGKIGATLDIDLYVSKPDDYEWESE